MGQFVNKIKRTLYPVFNILSGISIRLLGPFKKGDFIEVNGHLGSVENRGFEKTTIKDLEGVETELANTLFFTKNVHNLSLQNIVHFDFAINLSYSEDMAKIKQLISSHLSSQKIILKSPAPKIFVKKIKTTQVELGVKVWCSIEDYLEIESETEVLLTDFLEYTGVAIANEYKEEVNQMMA